MRYFKIDAAGEVVAFAEKYSDVPGAGKDPSIWARQPAGGVWDAKYSNGVIGAGWIDRNSFPSFEFAEKLAASAKKFDGGEWIPVDQGPSVYPQYDVMLAPKVGDDASKGFNGDYYPVGKVVKVSGANSKIVSVAGPRGLMKFYRKGLSSGWNCKGWGLVRGVVERLNPEF